MKKGLIVASAAVLALTAGAANAGSRDLHGAAAIRAGDFTKAEAILTAEQSGRWTTPETLLNLAHVYRHTDRVDAARALYERVLSEGNVLMNVGAARPFWSHDVARAGLTQLSGGTTTIAAR